jgi:hypothetical protein
MPLTPETYDATDFDAIPLRLARVRRTTHFIGETPIVSIDSTGHTIWPNASFIIRGIDGLDVSILRRACEDGLIVENRIWVDHSDWMGSPRESSNFEAYRDEIFQNLETMQRSIIDEPNQNQVICRFDRYFGMVVFRMSDFVGGRREIRNSANYGWVFDEFRFCWWEDWNRAISHISSAPVHDNDPVYQVPADPNHLPLNDAALTAHVRGPLANRLAAVVATPRRPGSGGRVVVVINAENATEYHNCGAAARAFNLQTQTVRNRCNRSNIVRDPRFIWATDWARAGENVPAAESPAPITDAPDTNGIYINRNGVVFLQGASIGSVSRCGLGHYAKIETAQGTVDFFHMQLAAIHAWIRSSALASTPRISPDNEEAGPQPASIRQPNGGRAEFDHRGRLRNRNTPNIVAGVDLSINDDF